MAWLCTARWLVEHLEIPNINIPVINIYSWSIYFLPPSLPNRKHTNDKMKLVYVPLEETIDLIYR